MTDTPKRIKRLLREYAGAAHEEELRRALLTLAGAFKRWEHGNLASGDLSEIIHHFHQGPARDFYVRYNTAPLEFAVAYAITIGILDRQTIPAELLASRRAASVLRDPAGGAVMRFSTSMFERTAGSHTLAAVAQRLR